MRGMQKHHDTSTGISITYPDNWVGEVSFTYPQGDGRTRFCVRAESLLSGRPTFIDGGWVTSQIPRPRPGECSIDALLRVTAICVELFWRWKMTQAAEQVSCVESPPSSPAESLSARGF